MHFKLGELFCGPGGLSFGACSLKLEDNSARSFSISHGWATDYDHDSCQTYINNIPGADESSVLCKNIVDVDFDRLSNVNALAFGFPCNDFSLVGQQKGLDGHFGGLYKYGVKAVNHFKPLWFVAENVGGLKSSNEGLAFRRIIDELVSEGYDVTPNLYKFENYGVPQSRHRILIVGIRSDLKLNFHVPAPSFEFKTCRQAIENPPISQNSYNNERTKQSEKVIQRLRHIKPGMNAFNSNLPDDLKLNVKGAQISQIYRRLNPNNPAYTVTGSGGGGTHIYHWDEPRALTNRERARLQTFPDEYRFYGGKESVRKQIGMAVPPDGAKVVITAILKTFAGLQYDSVPSNIDI